MRSTANTTVDPDPIPTTILFLTTSSTAAYAANFFPAATLDSGATLDFFAAGLLDESDIVIGMLWYVLLHPVCEQTPTTPLHTVRRRSEPANNFYLLEVHQSLH
eukprot:m.470991 g.470991  ORF g.470991 m.470991 type:complete len:104 (-) comp21657_c0_seq11:79-390(-)